MVTAPQAAIPPERKPRTAEGFFVGEETFVVTMGLLTKDDAAVVGEGRNAGGEDDDSIFFYYFFSRVYREIVEWRAEKDEMIKRWMEKGKKEME